MAIRWRWPPERELPRSLSTVAKPWGIFKGNFAAQGLRQGDRFLRLGDGIGLIQDGFQANEGGFQRLQLAVDAAEFFDWRVGHLERDNQGGELALPHAGLDTKKERQADTAGGDEVVAHIDISTLLSFALNRACIQKPSQSESQNIVSRAAFRDRAKGVRSLGSAATGS